MLRSSLIQPGCSVLGSRPLLLAPVATPAVPRPRALGVCFAAADNPSPIRRRHTTRRTTQAVPPAEQPAPVADSSSTSRRSSKSKGQRSTLAPVPERDVPSAAEQPPGSTAPTAAHASTSSDSAGLPASSTAAGQPSRKRPAGPTQEQQQVEPPNIRYTLSSAVSSYSDANMCSVHLDELPADSSDNSSSSSNGNSSSSNSRRSSSNGGRGPGAKQSASAGKQPDADRAYDNVRGLVYGATVRFSDSAALRLRRRAMVVWEEPGPRKVLIVKKPVPAAATTLGDMATWLQKRGLQVFVEPSVHASEFPHLQPFDPAVTQVDFAITLGGDGTVLHLASLFAEDMPLPPVMCFAMGTLGFLTPFDAAQFRSCLARVLAANRKPLYCTLRTRKRCAVLDAEGKLLRVHHILNECVVDRGAFPSSVYLELYIDGSFVTAAEADGLIIATPSGSTAYSMSAGGSMVAPSVPCTLVTPLSPHSLSFRPLIIPENADLMIRLPENARSHARASFDGKHPMRIAKGYSVHFETSLCPLPLINIGSLDVDWYEGITRKLKWNQSIRGVPSAGLEAAVLQRAAAAAAASGEAGSTHAPQLQPQLSLGGLVSDLTAAVHHEAKVANWVEEALIADAKRSPVGRQTLRSR